MNLLAIDHGDKRMGIAASDSLGMLAHPLEFINAQPLDKFLERLKEIIADRETEQIIVGMPRNMDGSIGPQALKVEDFVFCKTCSISVILPFSSLTLFSSRMHLRSATFFMMKA